MPIKVKAKHFDSKKRQVYNEFAYSYYRTFTDVLPNILMKKKFYTSLKEVLKASYHLKIILFVSFAVTSLVFLAFFFITLRKYEALVVAYRAEEKKLYYWEGVVKKHSNYPDGYYKAALHAYRLKNKEKALSYIQQAMYLDPYFENAEILEKDIRGL